MPTDICSITLTGRLTRDAELKYAQNGNPIVRFSIAVNRGKRNADGSWGEEAMFFECSYFGKSAEAVNSYLVKGRTVCVMGDFRQTRWEGNDGQTRYRLEVVVNQLTLTGGQSRGGEGSAVDMAMRQGSNNSGYSGNSSNGYASSSSYSSSSQPGNSYTRQQAQTRQPVSGGPEDFKDDDIPF